MAVKQERRSIDGNLEGKRIPVSHRDILKVRSKVDLEKDYVLRWVNDIDNRILDLKDAGYEYVNKGEIYSAGTRSVDNTGEQVDSRVSKVVSFDKLNHRPVTAYVMKQKKEWYEEDQQAKADEINKRKEAMVRKQKESGHYGSIEISD